MHTSFYTVLVFSIPFLFETIKHALSTFEAENRLFPKHAEVRAYKKKSVAHLPFIHLCIRSLYFLIISDVLHTKQLFINL